MAQPSQSISKFVKIITDAIVIIDSLIPSIVTYGHIFLHTENIPRLQQLPNVV